MVAIGMASGIVEAQGRLAALELTTPERNKACR